MDLNFLVGPVFQEDSDIAGAFIASKAFNKMEVGLDDTEMLLGPVETYPNALPAQETSTNVDPRRLSSTSSGDGITNNTPIESNKPATPASRRRAADPEIIQKVEAVVQQIVRSLQQEEGKVWISLRSRKRPGTSPSAQSSSRSPAQDQYKLSFPGETPEEAWRFSTAGLVEAVCSRTSSMLTCSPAVVLRILELIHEALVNDAVVSKRWANMRQPGGIFAVSMLTVSRCRNIYYKDPELFRSQKVVDRYVDILSHTFGIQRAALNVVSTFAFLLFATLRLTHMND